MNIQHLKTRFLLLVFMLLLSSNSGNIEFDLATQTKLLSNIDNTWPSLEINKLEIQDKSITSAETLVEAVKKIQTD